MRSSEFIAEGITHLEDLPIEQFINSLRRINSFEISEKIDGANLQFGIDETGKFFTSRGAKGGQKYYSIDDYGNKFRDTGFKSTHAALAKVAPKLVKQGLLKPGDTAEVEVLFGKLPNTVEYSGLTNQIIILRPVEAQEGIEELKVRLEKINKVVEGLKITVKLPEVPFTTDGKNIEFRPETHEWAISKTPQVDPKLVDINSLKRSLENKLKKLEDYLYEDAGIGEFTNGEILGLPLNKTPDKIEKSDWKTVLPLIKTKKAAVIDQVKGFQLSIKEDLLNQLVRNISSEFGPELQDGGWVEGLVFRDPKTNEMFKLIDKDMFTAINKFNWSIRNIIKSPAISNKFSDLNSRLVKRMSDVIETPELALARTAKKYLTGLKSEGKNPIEVIANKIDFKTTKSKWQEIISYHIKLLDKMLNWYDENKSKLRMNAAGGKSVEYSEGVDERTKQSFAELNTELQNMQEKIKNATTPTELISAFIGEKVDNLGEGRIIKEGGGAFDDVGAINISELKPTLIYLSEILGLSYSELNDYVLGSVGKAEFSGDMDVALKEFTPEEQSEFVKSVEEKLGAANVKKLPLGVTLKFPIQEYSEKPTERPRTGFVQIDLFFGDRDWNKFYYHSAGDKSKFKGAHRNLLIAAIAKNILNEKSEETDSFGRPIEQTRYMFSPTNGLIKVKRKSKKNKKGEWTKAQDTEQLSKPIKDEKLISKLLFGKIIPGVFDSFETLYSAVNKYLSDKSSIIFQDFYNGLPEQLKQFNFPKEISSNQE